MNKRGMLGSLVGLMIVLGVSFILFGTIQDEINIIKEGCLTNNFTSSNYINFTSDDNDSCFMFTEDFIFDKSAAEIIPYFFLFGVILITWNVLRPFLRELIYLFDGEFSIPHLNDSDEKNSNKQKKCLKETKSTYNKSKKRKIKTETESIDRGVNFGSGISRGEGIDKYGDEKNEKDR